VVPKTQTALCLCRKRSPIRFSVLTETNWDTVLVEEDILPVIIFKTPTSP
jgi:hypothetical protein